MQFFVLYQNVVRKCIYKLPLPLLFSLQAERFVDRKLNQAEDVLNKRTKKAKKWYTNLIGDETGCKVNDLHIFLCAFAAGVAIGVGTA